MLNEKIFEEIKRNITERAEKDSAIIRSWQNVGKNYATREDGKTFDDPTKSFRGVDGIKGISTIETWGGNVTKFLDNSENFSINITNKTLAEIEDLIKNEIKNAQEDYRYQKFLLLYLPKFCKQCNDLFTTSMSAYDKEIGKTANTEYALKFSRYIETIVKEYLGAMFDDMSVNYKS